MADESNVDALDKIATLFEDAREQLQSERLNSTSRKCVEAAIICGREDVPRDGWLRQSAEMRQWLILAKDFDKADVDRQIAEAIDKLKKKEQRAASRAAKRTGRSANLRVI